MEKKIPDLTAEEKDHFWSFVSGTDDPDGCWEWQPSTAIGYTPQYYLRLRGKAFYIQRIAYSLLVGPLPNGSRLYRDCRNVACVNPNHMYIGTVSGAIKRVTTKREFPRNRVRDLRDLRYLKKLA